jgi:hypothetical protein
MPEAVPAIDPRKSIMAVKYEYQMAYETAVRASQILRPKTHDDFVLAIALLESFLVHARVLHEFLSEDRRFATDLRAHDLVPGYGDTVYDADTIDSINRALQHLTVYRLDGHIPWYPISMLGTLVAAMGRFMVALEDARPGSSLLLSEVHASAEEAISTAPADQNEHGTTTSPVATNTLRTVE